ncbi:hypothetical protein EDF61_102426 [Arthrobacter sp. JUb115]|nr:hypothetical protein EDF61_102426 [Arthrobacter sp. JUb115]
MLRVIVETDSAFTAEPQAIFPANRLERQGGNHCAPYYRIDVNQVTDHPILIHIIIVFEFFALFIIEELLNISLEVVLDGLQASSTFPSDLRCSGTRYQNSFMHGFKAKI